MPTYGMDQSEEEKYFFFASGVVFLTSSVLVEIEGYFSLEFVNYVCETGDRIFSLQKLRYFN
jgi:hypothetical protein